MGKETPSSLTLSSRPPLERMIAIHHLLQEFSYPNARKLADELEVSAKTIRRDMDFMRDRLNLPIEYDSSRKGFYYAEAVSSFPGLQITEEELLALLAAYQAIDSYQGAGFQEVLRSAFAQLTLGMQDKARVSRFQLYDTLSFRTVGAGNSSPEILQQAGKAVLNQLEIHFDYKKPNADKAEERRVRPYHLSFIRGLWYLVAYDMKRSAMRTFALPRISNIKIGTEHFERDPNFCADDYFAYSFGALGGKAVIDIRIWFDAYAATLVRERSWHETQEITELSGGEIEALFRLQDSGELLRWAMGWGRHAKVLAPPEAVAWVKRNIEEMARKYDS